MNGALRIPGAYYVMSEVYAKLIVMLIQHWILLVGCWQYPDRSLFKAVKTIQRHAMNLACAFASGVCLCIWLYGAFA